MDLKIDEILMRVRSQLNKDEIKLWEPPYFEKEFGTCESQMEILSSNYSQILNLSSEHCSLALHELQSHALEKIKERNRFTETGISTVKVRIPGQAGGTVVASIQIKLSALGEDLKEAVAKEISNASYRIKLIYQGKVLKDELSLSQQDVKNDAQMMAVVLFEDVKILENDEKQRKLLESTKEDLKLLTKSQDEVSYLQVEDQSGNTLNLPESERKALVTAMTLHEKGRVALKKEDYSLALVMLLEADNEFSRCNSNILSSVDNYALLNLDIAWCYLCLKSVSYIPDAEERLQKCEANFHKSYGVNLERLIALKGTSGNEAALFMRLHLLQAIVMFHKNRLDEARNLLNRAERELEALKVDETSLCMLVDLGYSPAEARLGLRATHGNVNAAAEYITRNREERAASRQKALDNERLKRDRIKLGKCADGKQYIEPKLLDILTAMGFPMEAARSALAQTNNIVSTSVQLLHEHPELMDLAMASTSKPQITQSSIDQVAAMGFDPRMAKIALKKHNGNVEKALEELIASGGIIDGAHLTDDEDEVDDEENRKKKAEAFLRISDDLSMVDDDHLDLTLIQEENFLKQYKKLLTDL